MQVKAFQVAKPGGPSAMKWKTVEVGKPARGEVTVRHTAIGFNFIDINHRRGQYPLPLPTGIGMEAAGVIEAVGPGVKGLKKGQRVVYIGSVGAYSEAQNVPAGICIPIPSDITDEQAAATHLKGARCLFRMGLFDLLENIVLRDPWQLSLLATMDVRMNGL